MVKCNNKKYRHICISFSLNLALTNNASSDERFSSVDKNCLRCHDLSKDVGSSGLPIS